MNFTPLLNVVAIRPLPPAETSDSGLLVIPESGRRPTKQGIVVAVGRGDRAIKSKLAYPEGRFERQDKQSPVYLDARLVPDVQVGDRVLYDPSFGKAQNWVCREDGVEYDLTVDARILAVLEP